MLSNTACAFSLKYDAKTAIFISIPPMVRTSDQTKLGKEFPSEKHFRQTYPALI